MPRYRPHPENSGIYREVNVDEPWAASPAWTPAFNASSSIPALPEAKIRPKSIQKGDGGHYKGRRQRRKGLGLGHRLWRYLTGRSSADSVIAHVHHHIETDAQLQPQIHPKAWKAYAYWARPTVNGVQVDNTGSSPNSFLLRRIDPQAVFANLRGLNGSPHPENWIPGIEHPSLPPRPPEWEIPDPMAPLPFTWECQLNPLLVHKPAEMMSINFDVRFTPDEIFFNEGASKMAYRWHIEDEMQPATHPFLTLMHIIGVADDIFPWPWPLLIRSSQGFGGINLGQIFHSVYQNFQQPVSATEFALFDQERRDSVMLRLHHRHSRRGRDGGARLSDHDAEMVVKRVDMLGERTSFRGLESNPKMDGTWVLYLGPNI